MTARAVVRENIYLRREGMKNETWVVGFNYNCIISKK